MANEKSFYSIISILVIFIIIIIYFCLFYNNETYDYRTPKYIQTFVNKKIALASGVRVNGRPVVVNTITGEKHTACGKAVITSTQNNNQYDQNQEEPSECEFSIKGPIALEQAINSTKKPIQGFIIKNGVETPVEFQVFVKATFNGSYCSTTFAAGEQYEKCITQQEECIALRAALFFLPLNQFYNEAPDYCRKHITD